VRVHRGKESGNGDKLVYTFTIHYFGHGAVPRRGKASVAEFAS
jgi:hypothetical protein